MSFERSLRALSNGMPPDPKSWIRFLSYDKILKFVHGWRSAKSPFWATVKRKMNISALPNCQKCIRNLYFGPRSNEKCSFLLPEITNASEIYILDHR